MAIPQPAVVLLQGGWHTDAHYADILSRFREAGFITEKPEFPSMGMELPRPYGKPDDVASSRKVIARLADAGHPILVYMHSYGGVVGSDAVAGLTWRERKAKGGVVHMIYQAAFVLRKDECGTDGLGGDLLPFMDEDIEMGNCWFIDPPRAFFSGIPDIEVKKWCDLLVNFPTSALRDKVSNEPWRNCMCTYFICTNDEALPLECQEAFAGKLGESTRREYEEAGHAVFLEKPARTVEVVQNAWKVTLNALIPHR